MKGRLLIFISLLLISCRGADRNIEGNSSDYARYFEILDNPVRVVVMSPYDTEADTLLIDRPLDNLVCMSSSHVAALSAIGADSVITAVSGIRYISDPAIRQRWRDTGSTAEITPLYDIGYEADLDFERIMKIRPDLLLTYTVSGAEPQYIIKLRSLGIPVLVLHDHLEDHPLARAEYVRLFGALTGRQRQADSLFASVAERYLAAVSDDVAVSGTSKKLLLNIPYGDAWYIPGADSYMARLIKDAGGEVLGAEPGTSRSRVITMEQAYTLSQAADIWLNPGHCRTREELSRIHQLFPKFGPLANGLPIYNNTLRTTPEGGNDFWESGAVRPDLILEDLKKIISGDPADSLNYFLAVDQKTTFIS